MKDNKLNSYEQIYRLKPKDFIPFVGFAKHRKRCLEAYTSDSSLKEGYDGEWTSRNILLGLYNVAIIAGAVYASLGLAGFFSK